MPSSSSLGVVGRWRRCSVALTGGGTSDLVASGGTSYTSSTSSPKERTLASNLPLRLRLLDLRFSVGCSADKDDCCKCCFHGTSASSNGFRGGLLWRLLLLRVPSPSRTIIQGWSNTRTDVMRGACSISNGRSVTSSTPTCPIRIALKKVGPLHDPNTTNFPSKSGTASSVTKNWNCKAAAEAASASKSSSSSLSLWLSLRLDA